MCEGFDDRPVLGLWMRVSTVALLELGKTGNRAALWLSYRSSRLYSWAEKRALDSAIAEQVERREVRDRRKAPVEEAYGANG